MYIHIFKYIYIYIYIKAHVNAPGTNATRRIAAVLVPKSSGAQKLCLNTVSISVTVYRNNIKIV